MWKRKISDIEDNMEEMDSSKTNLNLKQKSGTKHLGKLECYEQTKSKNDRIRGRRRNTGQRHGK